MKKSVWLILLVLLLAGLGAVTALWLRDDKPTQTTDSAETVTSDGQPTTTPKLIIGDEAAPITIVEYGDFQCPICQRFFEQTELTLLSEYIDTGKAKLEFRVETHIGPESVTAGEAAYCAAEQGQFKEYHDVLYQQQGKLDFTSDNLKRFASELGLGTDEFQSCLDTGKYRATVEASNTEAQGRISGTPTFFIGDQRINGAQPIGVFRAILDSL